MPHLEADAEPPVDEPPGALGLAPELVPEPPLLLPPLGLVVSLVPVPSTDEVAGEEVEVPALEDEAVTHVGGTTVVAVAEVEGWLSASLAALAEAPVVVVVAAAEMRAGQLEVPLALVELGVEAEPDGVEVPRVFADWLRPEAPVTGPPNAASAVIFRRTGGWMRPAVGESAVATSLGALETVAATSPAMAAIPVGAAAAEDGFAAV